MKQKLSASEYLVLLQKQVQEFILFFQQSNDYTKVVYTDWSAKDVLGHIVSWHESFARNVDDLVHDRKPNPLKGSLVEVNEKGVLETKPISVQNLVVRLKSAQVTIEQDIMSEKITFIPYKKGSRDYSREEHLEVVYRHIKKHYEDLINCFNRPVI